MNNNVLLPAHGPIECGECFEGMPIQWDKTRKVFGAGNPPQWRIENNPAAWGARAPRYLVLGFSKGPNQQMSGRPFDEVAFAGMRNQLTSILVSLGLLSAGEHVEDKIRPTETEWGFGSLVRCSIARWDAVSQDHLKTGGNILVNATTDPEASKVLRRCVEHFLTPAPNSLRVVIMLGNDQRYVDACRRLFAAHDADIVRLNDVSYGNGRLLWVHTVHPKAQGSHLGDWLGRNMSTGQGRKGRMAEEAVRKWLSTE
ncbi:MAG: hypothetical protein Kow006_31640 [Gammaproteobacteria bacterium]